MYAQPNSPMPENSKGKICLLVISLAKGGAERSTALLSQMLDKRGFDVHIVILNDAVDYNYAGTLFNLGKFKSNSDQIWDKFQRIRKLRKYLISGNFDRIIDNRSRPSALKEWIYTHFVYKSMSPIYVVRNAKLSRYIPGHKHVAQKMIDKAYALVGVSKYIADEINRLYHSDKALCIYN